jgi:thiol-disulfide isomerase/thioredoxin
VLVFWAIWCGPCQSELPSVQVFHSGSKNSGIVVIGVHTPGSKLAEIQKHLKDNRLEYPIFVDKFVGEVVRRI